MKALSVLYGGSLAPEAFAPLGAGPDSARSAIHEAAARAARFPGVDRTVILMTGDGGAPVGEADVIRAGGWTTRSFLETLARLAPGYDLVYVAWADCPCLDPALAGALAERHLRYAAEYSYADGWPYGLAPEILAPGAAGILARILGDGDDGPVARDALFTVIQKDINAFDIETEIAPEDFRLRRLCLAADSRRGLLLVRRFVEAGLTGAADVGEIIAGRPEILRTLPAFFPVQVTAGCPQACGRCPWPRYGARRTPAGGVPVTERRETMDPAAFEALLDRVIAFAGDGVVDLSLWGEVALHPDRLALARAALRRPELALVIETSGLNWSDDDLETLAAEAAAAPRRIAPNHAAPLPPLSWIVSLDALDPGRYREARGPGFAEAAACARRLLDLFPRSAYVQAVRTAGAEDDIEGFYRHWKEAAGGAGERVIIQKYDDFCGALPRLQASDLSPVRRRPCWHALRDLPVLLDGTVPTCREDLGALRGDPALPVLGNVFTDSLDEIWRRGEQLYLEQCRGAYPGICAGCDEYYTYNF